MPIRVRCQCDKTYSVKEELAGKKIRCKACGAAIPVKPTRSDVGQPMNSVTSAYQDEDDFDGLDFGSGSSFSNVTLPPRRTAESVATRPKAEKPKSQLSSPTLEDRISSRTAAEVEENVRGAPWRELASAFLFFVIGAALYYYLDLREQEGGFVRLPRILAVVYLAIGKWGILAICWGISLLSVVAAALAFTGVIRIYHSEDD